jgi:AraC-like DNA-binding protein
MTEEKNLIGYLGGEFGRIALNRRNTFSTEYARTCFRIFCVVGNGIVRVRRQDTVLSVDKDHFLFTLPQHPVSIEPLPDSSGEFPLLLTMMLAPTWMDVSDEPLGAALRRAALPYVIRVGVDQLTHHLLPGKSCGQHADMDQLLQEIKGFAQDIMGNVHPPVRVEFKTETAQEKIRLSKIFSLLSEMPEKGTSLKSIAHDCDISIRHLFNVFKKATGMTPNNWLTMHRIESGFAYLNNPELSITDISYQLGFSAPPHFTRLIKQYSGFTPQEYRRMLSKMPDTSKPILFHPPVQGVLGIQLR